MTASEFTGGCDEKPPTWNLDLGGAFY